MRNETVKLVREYLNCVDELTTIRLILQKKVELFQTLLLDVKKFEADDLKSRILPDNPAGETAEDRINFALKMYVYHFLCLPLLRKADGLFTAQGQSST